MHGILVVRGFHCCKQFDQRYPIIIEKSQGYSLVIKMRDELEKHDRRW